MVANNLQELNNMIRSELEKAMSEAASRMRENLEDGVKYFYDGGEPLIYQRTGALGRTPEVSPVKASGDQVSFEAYLNKDHIYGSGKNPTMNDVLDLANYGYTYSSVGQLHPTVGNMGFWEKAEEDMQETLDSVMSKYFKKG